MGYRNKEECLKQAERLGLDITGMSWQELQQAVKLALLKEALGVDVAEISKDVDAGEEDEELQEPENGKPDFEKRLKLVANEMVQELKGQKITLAPELYPDYTRAIHYDEEIGDDIQVEEKYYDIRNLEQALGGGNMASGTYILKGRTGRKVVAESALPKENPGLDFTFGKDYVNRVSFNGKTGYRWTYVKKLLLDSGYYHQFKDRFRQPYIWYAAGVLVVDIGLTHAVFREIEDIERTKKERGW